MSILKTRHYYLAKQCLKYQSIRQQIAFTSTNASPKELYSYDKVFNVTKRETKKKPARAPFAKNLFLGIFDYNMLTYPEVLDKEDLESLDRSIEKFYEYFAGLPPENLSQASTFMEGAKNLKLIGMQVPQWNGGREYNMTESCRFNDVTSECYSDITLNCNEQLGLQLLLKFGNEKQQNTYLRDVCAGHKLTAFCMEEYESSSKTMQTNAIYTAGKWILNGKKTRVVNGSNANLLFVMAQTEFINKLGINECKPTIFMVERGFGEITSEPLTTVGLNKTDVADVTFNDVVIPPENIINEINNGEEVVSVMLRDFRLSSGPACATLTKILLNRFIEHCKQSNDDTMIQAEIVLGKISDIATSVYAMESMTFLTAALIDQYEKQDCDMEAAIVKAFSAEKCVDSTTKCMNFLGSPAYMEGHWCNDLHKNALNYICFNESMDTLKILIALQGLQHAGVQLQDKINKIRNPLFYVSETLKRMFTQRRQINDNPKLTLRLKDYLHPSATIAANWLEYSVLRFQFATEFLLARYGNEVVLKHQDLIRIADCIIDIYAMNATLGRASRSYCIGLQNGDYEMLIANAFCLHATERVKVNVQKLLAGPHNTNDRNYTKLGEQLINSGHYFPKHPLTKNF